MGDGHARTYDVAVLPGDGIGREVMPAALEVLEAAGRRHGFAFRWTEHDWSCDRFHKTGAMMPADAVDQVRTKPRRKSLRDSADLIHIRRSLAETRSVCGRDRAPWAGSRNGERLPFAVRRLPVPS